MRTTYLLLMLITWLPAAAFEVPVPAAPPIAGSGYIVVDFHSGQVIAKKEPDQRLEPASITKLMTAYIAFNSIANGNLAPDEMVTVSENAYRTVGSRMFIEVREPVSVDDLLKGMIVQSGNDASVALAEHIAGSEQTFAELMNQYAQKLGLNGTRYENSTGLPGPDHYSTPRDIATLAAAIIREFPEFYKLYSLREFTYNGIEQFNRNSLLWRDESVDGVKTGHTDSAGYCLVASAERDGMRLITVVMGTDSERARSDASMALLNYGFRFFETHNLYRAGEPITTAPVWKGAAREVGLGVLADMYVTVPRGHYDSLAAVMDLDSVIVAPLATSDDLGELRVALGEQVLQSARLYPVRAVAAGGLLRRAIDEVMLWFE